MSKLEKRYVIGTHVMWFEIEMFADFIDGMINLMETVENKENVTIDFILNMSEKLEQIDTDKITSKQIIAKFSNEVGRLISVHSNVTWKINDGDDFYFHADYRRDLNYNYCKKVDYVMWGETDSLFPKEAFQVIETLAIYTDDQNFAATVNNSIALKADASAGILTSPTLNNATITGVTIQADPGGPTPNRIRLGNIIMPATSTAELGYNLVVSAQNFDGTVDLDFSDRNEMRDIWLFS